MLVECSRLVVRSLENGSASHRSFRSCNDGEVLARNPQQYLPKRLSVIDLAKVCAMLTSWLFRSVLVGGGRVDVVSVVSLLDGLASKLHQAVVLRVSCPSELPTVQVLPLATA